MKKIDTSSMKELIDTTIQEWEKKTLATLKKETITKLEKHKDEILLKLLGFDTEYGTRGFKLDHCNGRAGNSPLGFEIKQMHQEAIDTWLKKVDITESLEKISEVELTKIIKLSLGQYNFKSKVQETVKNLASNEVEKIAQGIIEQSIKEINDELALENLLHQ